MKEFEETSRKVAEELAEKEDKILYKAAKRYAHSVIFEKQDFVPLENQEVKFCQTEDEFEEARKEFGRGYFYELTAEVYRMAEKTDSYEEFRELVKERLEEVEE